MKLFNQMAILSGFVMLLLNGPALATPPPTYYVDKDTCPYEGCFYGFWRVDQDFPLYDRVKGKKIVGWAKKNTNIKSLTGEVHTIPDIIQFGPDYTAPEGLPYKPNTKAYVLTSEGEGYYDVWYQGQMLSDDSLLCVLDAQCSEVPKGMKRIKTGQRTWWIKFMLKNKTVGWAKDTNQKPLPFSMADQLGGYELLKGFDDHSKRPY